MTQDDNPDKRPARGVSGPKTVIALFVAGIVVYLVFFVAFRAIERQDADWPAYGWIWNPSREP
ncbi:MAG: hypothetical protein RIC16_15135 [Rhodospirillales bacterium]